MTRVLLACLLAFALTLAGQAHNGRPGQAKLVRSPRRTAKAAGAARRAPAEAMPQAVVLHSYNQPDGTPALPLDSLRSGALGAAEDVQPVADILLRGPVAPIGPRRYRNRLVRGSRWSSRRETVEILTCTDAGPLVLAMLPTPSANGEAKQLVAGSGTEPLRPLPLTRDAVLRLCGARAYQVRAFAMTYDLHFDQAADVARMLDYFNRKAVVKE